MAQEDSVKLEIRINPKVGAQLLLGGKPLPNVKKASARKLDDGMYQVLVELMATEVECEVGDDVEFEA